MAPTLFRYLNANLKDRHALGVLDLLLDYEGVQCDSGVCFGFPHPSQESEASSDSSTSELDSEPSQISSSERDSSPDVFNAATRQDSEGGSMSTGSMSIGSDGSQMSGQIWAERRALFRREALRDDAWWRLRMPWFREVYGSNLQDAMTDPKWREHVPRSRLQNLKRLVIRHSNDVCLDDLLDSQKALSSCTLQSCHLFANPVPEPSRRTTLLRQHRPFSLVLQDVTIELVEDIAEELPVPLLATAAQHPLFARMQRSFPKGSFPSKWALGELIKSATDITVSNLAIRPCPNAASGLPGSIIVIREYKDCGNCRDQT